jgi:hypothetical protein
MTLLEKARQADPVGKGATNDRWGKWMPAMRILVERGFTSVGAARWLEEEGEIPAGAWSHVALSYRQRCMRERQRKKKNAHPA